MELNSANIANSANNVPSCFFCMELSVSIKLKKASEFGEFVNKKVSYRIIT